MLNDTLQNVFTHDISSSSSSSHICAGQRLTPHIPIEFRDRNTK